MGGLPKGWNDYVRTGARINGTRFIAFKVPLRESLNINVTEENKWHPRLLVTLIPDIGIVIDLTFTAKYYGPQDFLQLGVDHKKIYVEGHQIPTTKNYQTFRQTVNEFLRDNANNDKLIGVHCTHGLNRTGFMVCRYMIQEMRMSAERAIELFEEARGHKIERENYTNKLRTIERRISRSLSNDSDSNASGTHGRQRHHSIDDDRLRRTNRRSNSPNRRHIERPSNHRDYRNEYSYARPPPQQHFSANENGNWRDPNHQYPPCQPRQHLSAPISRRRSMQNQRIRHFDNRTNPRNQSERNNSSPYVWRRDARQ